MVMESHSSRMMSLNPALAPKRMVEANALISFLTTSMPRSVRGGDGKT